MLMCQTTADSSCCVSFYVLQLRDGRLLAPISGPGTIPTHSKEADNVTWLLYRSAQRGMASFEAVFS